MIKEVFALELLVTRKCNQKCYYCSHWRDAPKYKLEVDLDYVQYVIDLFRPCVNGIEFWISISGGETGLVENIVELLEILKKQNIKILLDSNGLYRLKGYPLELIDRYYEHLVFDVEDKELKKFYELDFVYAKNVTNVIVLTRKTLQSLLKNFDYYKPLYNPFFWFKPLEHKNVSTYEDLSELTNKFLSVLKSYKTYHISGLSRECYEKCYRYPPTPVVDVQMKTFNHCSVNFWLSNKFPVNSNTVEKFFKKQLIEEVPDYCKFCNNASCQNYSNPIANRSLV